MNSKMSYHQCVFRTLMSTQHLQVGVGLDRISTYSISTYSISIDMIVLVLLLLLLLVYIITIITIIIMMMMTIISSSSGSIRPLGLGGACATPALDPHST